MKATNELKKEHEAVRMAMGILDKICTRIENSDPFDEKHLEQMLEFIRVFTDKCHHGKEEDILFPAMEAAGVPGKVGPIMVMLDEHETMREYIRNFAQALDAYKQGEKAAAQDIAENVRAYLGWLDAHIDKENNILFAIADQYLNEREQEKLYSQFEQLEQERIGSGVHEQFHQMLNELQYHYSLPAENTLR